MGVHVHAYANEEEVGKADATSGSKEPRVSSKTGAAFALALRLHEYKNCACTQKCTSTKISV